jgi:predicted nuclease of predicted toxin-antitoxin system
MARYLIDANLPRRFAPWSGPDYQFVHDMGDGLKDTDIWRLAIEHDLTIVSKDADFSDRVLLSDTGPHVIHIRIGNLRMSELHGVLTAVWDEVCAASASARLVQVYQDRIECIE